jgi:hypothetical protein
MSDETIQDAETDTSPPSEAAQPRQPTLLEIAAGLGQFENAIAIELQRAIRDGTLDDRHLDRWEDLKRESAPAYMYAGRFAGARRLSLDLGRRARCILCARKLGLAAA